MHYFEKNMQYLALFIICMYEFQWVIATSKYPHGLENNTEVLRNDADRFTTQSSDGLNENITASAFDRSANQSNQVRIESMLGLCALFSKTIDRREYGTRRNSSSPNKQKLPGRIDKMRRDNEEQFQTKISNHRRI